MFGVAFQAGALLSGSVNTGSRLITTTDIYCNYFDRDINAFSIKGPFQPCAFRRHLHHIASSCVCVTYELGL